MTFLNQKQVSLQNVIQNVQSMTEYSSTANILAKSMDLTIASVTWEDCARNKGSVWGPCISDMTLQVGDSRMPVMREPNYTDKTWDIPMDKIPIVIGNETEEKQPLKTITLTEYLANFDQYMSNPPEGNSKLSLIASGFHKQTDTHVIMSSQCCFLPIESGKETKFNIALYNYQSKKSDPAILVIVSTSKGTSAQIIEGQDQELLFNNQGRKADFIGQRLTDNRRERGVKLTGAMTTQEKQDNCIVIIQVPLKQKSKISAKANIFNVNYKDMSVYNGSQFESMLISYEPKLVTRSLHFEDKCEKKSDKANVEAAIVKIAPKLTPVCICGSNLNKCQIRFTYNKSGSYDGIISCDGCTKEIKERNTIVWHCPQEKKHYMHRSGYDLCMDCGEKQLQFSELNGMSMIARDERYPVRVTLQYYKSTDNGIVNQAIMQSIKDLLMKSQKQADFIGSLVVDNNNRPTEPELNVKVGSKMYIKIYNALKEFGGEDWLVYYSNFVEQEVNDEDVKVLTDTDFVELIPKMGPRSRFKKWVQQRKQNEGETNFMDGLL